MSSSKGGIFVDFSGLDRAIATLQASLPAVIHEAIGEVAQYGQEQWQALVWGAKIWEGEKRPYFESIQWRFTGPLSAEIYTDYKLAEEIEKGRPARDLKEMLARSPKVKISAKGNRYLAIPFRHNVGALQAAGVYSAAKNLAPSKVTGQGTRLSQALARPSQVPSRTYSWGAKLKGSGNTNGMYRFNTSTGKSKSSSYLTFRTMSENSSGWIIPAKPGLGLAKMAEGQVQREAQGIVKAKFS